MNIAECTKIVEQYLAPRLLERIGIKNKETKMKLVTITEAVESGKRFRYVNPKDKNDTSDWLDKLSIGWSEEIYSVKNFFELAWQIEQEPREFWLVIDKAGLVVACNNNKGEIVLVSKFTEIKVREVME